MGCLACSTPLRGDPSAEGHRGRGPSTLPCATEQVDRHLGLAEAAAMVAKTAQGPSSARSVGCLSREGATLVAVAVLGTLVGLAGAEHRIGESPGRLISSWWPWFLTAR